jgi:hypothetical protein
VNVKEYKFKVWTGTQMLDEGFSICSNGLVYDIHKNHQAGWIVREFTGRKDKNSADIFGSDIVCQSGMNVPVVWNDKWACWELGFSIHSVEDSELQNLDFSDFCDLTYLVGNIYQNPELIPKTE